LNARFPSRKIIPRACTRACNELPTQKNLRACIVRSYESAFETPALHPSPDWPKKAKSAAVASAQPGPNSLILTSRGRPVTDKDVKVSLTSALCHHSARFQ
jgi:hypothetical protein